MARSFSSPQGAPPKMKTGHVRPQMRHGKGHTPFGGDKELDPLRHASSKIPAFSDRHSHTNGKFGFHTQPPRPPAGRLARRPGKVNRGSGTEHRAQL